jgi:hypothetical protein
MRDHRRTGTARIACRDGIQNGDMLARITGDAA